MAFERGKKSIREEIQEGARIALAAMGPPRDAPRKSSEDDMMQEAIQAKLGRKRQEQAESRSPYPAQRAPVQSAPTSSSCLVYGDGEIVEAGDLIMKGDVLAEVKIIAGNGVVLDIPAQGKEVVQPSTLLEYKKVGSRKKRA
jgi:hypothetical protein